MGKNMYFDFIKYDCVENNQSLFEELELIEKKMSRV
jgi:hypothetical protein